MFTKNTLLILGAGGSVDVGMPVGTELAARISTLARELYRFPKAYPLYTEAYEAVTRLKGRDDGAHHETLQVLENIANRVLFSGSIDRFIDENADNQAVGAVGKLLIAHTILAAESSSVLREAMVEDNRIALDFGDLPKSWYPEFAHRWLTGIRRTDVASAACTSLKVISFNYDRCFELYILNYLISRYDMPMADAIAVLDDLGVMHPYGAVGLLPGFAGRGPAMPFGGIRASGGLRGIAETLKTFTEAADSAAQERIAKAMEWAQRVVYLGFAYEPDNMRLLTSSAINPIGYKQLFGTAFGLPEPMFEFAAARIAGAAKAANTWPGNPQVKPMTCIEFVRHFGGTWT